MEILKEAEENAILDEFRNQVKDLHRSDGTLLRFLRARNHDIHNAELMLRKSIQWRKENDIDNALKWKINEDLYQKFPFEYPGVDYQNRAIVYGQVGRWPIRENVEAGYRKEMVPCMHVAFERIVAEIKKTGEQCTAIVDMAECSYWSYAHYETLQHCFQIFRTYEANYPERLAEAYIINFPHCFFYIWSLFKPFLNGTTLSKIKLLGGDEEKYMPILLEKIPPTSFPVALRKYLK